MYEKSQTKWETFFVTYEDLQQYLMTIGETNLVYIDHRHARAVGLQDIPLPTTYLSLFWQDFHIPWLDNQPPFILNAKSFTYNEPMFINHEYHGQITLSTLRKRGNKQFAIHDFQIYTQEKMVATMKTTLMLTARVLL